MQHNTMKTIYLIGVNQKSKTSPLRVCNQSFYLSHLALKNDSLCIANIVFLEKSFLRESIMRPAFGQLESS